MLFRLISVFPIREVVLQTISLRSHRLRKSIRAVVLPLPAEPTRLVVVLLPPAEPSRQARIPPVPVAVPLLPAEPPRLAKTSRVLAVAVRRHRLLPLVAVARRHAAALATPSEVSVSLVCQIPTVLDCSLAANRCLFSPLSGALRSSVDPLRQSDRARPSAHRCPLLLGILTEPCFARAHQFVRSSGVVSSPRLRLAIKHRVCT